MGHLAAEQRRHLGGAGLHLQGLQVVGGEDEVQLGGELVGLAVVGVEPVAREDGQLAVGREGAQLIVELVQVGVQRQAVLQGHRVGVVDVGLQRVQRVHVVESRQVVQPQDVAVKELRALQQVADDAGVVRDRDAVGLVAGDGRRMGVGHGAHAADALDDLGGVLGSTVLHDELHAAEATAGNPRVGNDAVLHFHLDAEMALDTGNRINNGTCQVSSPPSSRCCGDRRSCGRAPRREPGRR